MDTSGRGLFGLDRLSSPPLTMTIFCSIPIIAAFFVPFFLRELAFAIGWLLRQRTSGRRSQLVALMTRNDRAYQLENGGRLPGLGNTYDSGWDGVVGFFHPFCNAGGGGERVLWAAVRATQSRWPRAKCVVYTGDHEMTKEAIIKRVRSQNRFNIELYPPTVVFLYLSKRHWVLPATWPRFTLLGQSLGSMVLAWDAFSLLVPDIFIDTMGYAFALGLCKLLFRRTPTGAYVHYPTISTDMLDSLDPTSRVGSQGVNAGQGTGARGWAKKAYWRLFARLYSLVGSSVDVVMTNSTWTQAHIQSLWGPHRRKKDATNPIAVVYPPVAVREVEEAVELSEASEEKREKVLLYIAQFRPEKNHQLVLQSFAEFLKTGGEAATDTRLVLIGSVRDDQDSKKVYQLRLLANELGVKDRVVFQLDASWPEILGWLGRASVGVNGMWNEHFGIGVVEYQAAGLIAVVHDSGGPKLDIVVDIDGEPTGFHATSAGEFATCYAKALSVADPLAIRKRARSSSRRFTEEAFATHWLNHMDRLMALARRR
ncbi:hypothetical protein L249_6078 [Ophiocordyceps polyrhachis-furcata BCC 54312]|uniref:GDP-Man:Man(3)GlcNAc(2)-PP-Dol alpha-1,2-mannosyltransferase n=1 Tax=Ophiocordyceps polyrhachis-furcata BCC 54312 TaxID=1330021 RepID=A0A367LI99_9HYPO|nr:hypothetical protein L249_6078 [Ophiocordyceps polyrhachis-furcata BCC 54312]